jgi:hypothetical protein
MRRPGPSRLYEMGDDLGVSVGREMMASRQELASKLLVILDDTVVDDGDATGAVQMRMSVAVRGSSVGGPARVTNAAGTVEVCHRGTFPQMGNATGTLHSMEVARR